MYDMLSLCLSSDTITESPQHTKYIFIEPLFLGCDVAEIIFDKKIAP